MSNELTPQNIKEAPEAGAGVSVLELDEIQGDVLLGLQKFFERFVFFEIKDVKTFKAALRHKVAHRITTSRTVELREFQLRDHKNQGSKTVLPNVGLNLGFTNSGILKLVPGANLKDPSYAVGAKAQAASLNDPVDAQKNPNTWVPQFLNANIDGVFLITGGTQAAVDEEAVTVLAVLGATVTVSFDQTGNVRPDSEKGHEHFGWLDGVSQPGINGLSNPFPGQRLLDPGLFVFGYGTTENPPLVWMKNGSFMVFRRLKQMVLEFDTFTLNQGQTLGMDPVLLAARLVGRWKSGAPIALTPAQDDSTMGPDPQRNNNLDFADDQAQRRCPFGAHIRKTNPREDLVPQEKGVDPHRIIRAGIPYGPEVSSAEETAGATQQDRGLMFVCYQTSISNQFEFVQSKWANNPGFIFGKKHPDGTPVTVGIDPIIGQSNAPNRARATDELVSNYPTGNVRSTLNEPQDFVIPTGAGYFFMPSIEAVENELSS